MPRSPALSRLFEQHRGPVVRYLRRRLGDDAAEDAAIAVFTRAVEQSASGLDRYRCPRPWLFAIATAVISERWRVDRSRLERLERLAHQPPPRHPALGPQRPLEPRIAAGLRSLSAVDRETVLLLTWGELPRAEVATTLGIPLSAVRDRLERVAAQLPRIVHDEPGDGDGARPDGGPDDRPVTPEELLAVLGDGARPDGGPDDRPVTPEELLAVLGDNADLGLSPTRQPRIESTINRRFAVAPARLRPHPLSGDPQPIGA